MSELRLLHLADAHLGGSGPAFGTRVHEHQGRLMEAFSRAIEEGIHRQVDAVLIAGDLFDARRPSERTLQEAVAQLNRLGALTPPIHCFLLPGTHDCLDAHSVYRRPEFSAPHLHVWTAEGPATFRLPDDSLAVHGNPQWLGHREHRPLRGLAPDPSATFNVALAHGSIELPGLVEEDDALIARQDIAACAMDYVALGHWHDLADYSAGKVVARYSGSPEITSVKQAGIGGALVVTLSGAGARVERVQTGTLRCESLELSPETHPDEAAVAAAIERLADPSLLLSISLAGLAPEGFTCDVAQLQEELAGRFFRLRITDESVPAPTHLEAPGAAQALIAATAVRLFHERIERARTEGDAETERLTTRALQIAVALFDGKEVLG
jgi:DNA repair exonuclease SbcCD nuclease subunit